MHGEVILSLDDFGDEVFFEWLDTCAKFFRSNRIAMEATATVVDEIIILVKNTIASIDREKLRPLFTKFQDTIEVEFSKKGQYENKILVKLQDQYRNVMKNYTTNMQNAFEASKRYERNNQRRISSHNLETLRHLVLREPKVDLEKSFIGLSYAYASLVSGIFRFTLQDCYTWEKLSDGEVVDPNVVANKDVPYFQNYYKQKNDLIYFEGYDPIVRNSVAHSNFEYDTESQEITYVNESQPGTSLTGVTTTDRKTVTYSYEQMVENYHKIEKIYELIMITNQVLMVNTCLFKLTERHP